MNFGAGGPGAAGSHGEGKRTHDEASPRTAEWKGRDSDPRGQYWCNDCIACLQCVLLWTSSFVQWKYFTIKKKQQGAVIWYNFSTWLQVLTITTVAKIFQSAMTPHPTFYPLPLWLLGLEGTERGITISSSSTRSCRRHFRDTLCSLASWRVSLRTVVLKQITTSTLPKKGRRSQTGRSAMADCRELGNNAFQNSWSLYCVFECISY